MLLLILSKILINFDILFVYYSIVTKNSSTFCPSKSNFTSSPVTKFLDLKMLNLNLYAYNSYICTYNFIAMDTKLTLKLNQEIIEKAKIYAAQKKVSLSRIIENYLNSLTNETKNEDSIEISPFVKSIKTGNSMPADLDYKKEYAEHLLNKHK